MVAQANKIIQNVFPQSASSPSTSPVTTPNVSSQQSFAHVSSVSGQAPYVPIPVSYGFGPYVVIDPSSLDMSGFYAGQGHNQAFTNAGGSRKNNFGRRSDNGNVNGNNGLSSLPHGISTLSRH